MFEKFKKSDYLQNITEDFYLFLSQKWYFRISTFAIPRAFITHVTAKCHVNNFAFSEYSVHKHTVYLLTLIYSLIIELTL